MAYTSGRTVKSKARRDLTPRDAATRAIRALITAHYSPADRTRFSVNTIGTADPATLAAQTRTTVTFPETVDASDLACAVEGLTGYLASTWSTVSLTVTLAA